MVRARRNCSPVNGVLLLDKPVGFTSNQALQTVKRLLNACKAGHTGSLDPIATGLLPLFFGEATKLTQFLLNADKRYWTVFKLGVSTTTFDSEGEATATRPVTVGLRDIERALLRFQGEIEQIPPMYSAIKHNGEALYKLARAGVEVEREPRPVTVYEIKALGFQDNLLTLEIACSKGTYIRTLAHDLGEILGCGAHVVQLRRLATGDVSIDKAVTLDRLEALASPVERAQLLQPVDSVLHAVPDVHLTSLAAHYLKQGQSVSARHGLAPGWVRLYEGDSRFLGMGQVLDDGQVAPRRLLALTESP
ncbi:tRNA pseudouridine(55) synthase TruB [Sulfuricaulis sp.]|uniref:tRNA pseudouridine(55) synthase TruB n=1 Tax=Sulfuricaulis sp. TaxID=2003553 RepID=UPI003C763374